jgi:hypothetical protein
MKTPDRPVSPTPPPGGSTSYPLGRGAPPAPTPGAPNDSAVIRPSPDGRPAPRNPDDLVRER